MPILTVIAGPNGSYKSTLSEWVDLEDRGLLIDADSIARSMSPMNPRGIAIAAGREVLKRIDGHVGRKESFAVETTLSSRASLRLIARAHPRGYEVHLIFVSLDSPERCIARIRNRALCGGHFIPDADVRRRYTRSKANLPQAIRAADIAKGLRQLGDEHRLVLSALNGVVISRSCELPFWPQH